MALKKSYLPIMPTKKIRNKKKIKRNAYLKQDESKDYYYYYYYY